MKKPLPAWSIAAVLVVVLAGVGVGVLTNNGPSIDKDTLIKARAKPGAAPPPASESYGRPRGAPITPADSGAADPRRKPVG